MKKLATFYFLLSFLLTNIYCQINWKKDPNNPVLVSGNDAAWDDFAVGSASIFYDGIIYHMWFNGSDGNSVNIGYASSSDKIIWEKHPTPVLENGPDGSWDDLVVVRPTVFFDGTTYHMWYYGYDTPGHGSIGYATSPDPLNWTKYSGNPVLTRGEPGRWNSQNANSPEVLFIDSVFHMWYDGRNEANYTQIGHATSLDGITWENDELNPVLEVGEVGNWDEIMANNSSVLFDGTNYHMWYAGGKDFNWSIGYASSKDGRIWQKDDINNPVIKPGITDSWDSKYTGFPCVYFNSDSTGFDMWYTGASTAGYVGDIGYATTDSTDGPVSINEKINNKIPSEFQLFQNYPNPFNPSTTIKYSIPKESEVKIKIFDVLSSELATLVNKVQPEGNYEVEFDGNELTSGIYFYRLQAGNFIETKKMILLK